MPLRPTSGGHHCCLNTGAEGVGSPGWLGAVPVRSPRKSPRDPRRRLGMVAEGIKLRRRLKLCTLYTVSLGEFAGVARRGRGDQAAAPLEVGDAAGSGEQVG